jgi:dihydrodipicolinate synthase/N-acetylneuraminate lyase
MLPSEQAGLQGAVQAQGGHMPDFLTQMMNAWPTGRAGKGITWMG